ncbi:LytR/AlgR family response regulator transcription factor [Lysobacter sp. cf310]|uniref:LytR/AlgR family response regulator transcription factor n=1 Tax=Lysobacter sp. cf310 TaxID=1761790 RepID=UPI0008EE893F|nr:LytTR family DNA-binding domain-containing protein [Lysobacter sp. cf310]SFK65256.1 two component transcriptional regulator, LytTR family [Lysobacter sp. cf310]
MNALRVAIVDDEPLARARLRRLLGKVGNGSLEVVAECVDAEELIAIADSARLDVLFLDIEMPGVGGFGALARWQGPRPQVVFVTAYPQHGVRAFDARATDYLMKPVSAERLRDTLKRVRESMPALAASMPVTGQGKRLSLQVGQRTHLVPVEQIDLVLAQGNYLDVHAAGAVYTVRGTLTEFHGGLEAQRFVRVHRSAVVRVAAVREIRPIGSGRFRISLWGGQHLHSGRHYRDQMHELIG